MGDIPENIEVTAKSRHATVKNKENGKVLERTFKHMRMEMTLVDDGKKLKIEAFFANKKERASLRTNAAHIRNMITGVIQGFIYELRAVYNHFPISLSIVEDGKRLEIRNFVGQKRLFAVPMREGAIVKMADAKDTLEVWGDDLEAVSGSASDIQQSVRVRKKDIRKFLDGIYVSDKRHIVEIEE